MLNLLLFLILFFAVAFVFDLYCSYRLNVIVPCSKRVLPLDLQSVLVISIIVLIPTFLIAFRSESTGVDTVRYIAALNKPEEIILYKMHESGEYLYWGLCHFFQNHGTIRGLFFVLAFIPLFFVFAGIYKLSCISNPIISSSVFLLIFYQECFNITRQMPAIALVFFSITFCFSRKIIPYLICVYLASLFHSTALVALPIYFLYPRKVMGFGEIMKKIILSAFIVVGVVIFLKYVITLDFFQHYEVYSKTMFQVSLGQALLSFMSSHAPIILVMIYFSVTCKSDGDLERKDKSFLWSVVVFFCLFNVLRCTQNWLFRLGYYYQLGEILLIGKLCSKKVQQGKRLIENYFFAETDVLVVLVILFSYFIYNISYYDVSPFVNFSLVDW